MFPFIWYTNDYHEFDNIADILSHIIGGRVKFKELDEGSYYAVFYLDTIPKNLNSVKRLN